MKELNALLKKNPFTVLTFEKYDSKERGFIEETVITQQSLVPKVRREHRKKGFRFTKWNKKDVSGLDDAEKEIRELKESLRGLKNSLRYAKRGEIHYTEAWFDKQNRYIRETTERLSEPVKERDRILSSIGKKELKRLLR